MSNRSSWKSLVFAASLPAWVGCESSPPGAALLVGSAEAAAARQARETLIPAGAVVSRPTPGSTVDSPSPAGDPALEAVTARAAAIEAARTDGPVVEPKLESQEARIEGDRATSPSVTSFRVRDAREYFATLEERFQPKAAQGLEAVFQFQLTGAGGGIYNVAIDDGHITTERGASLSPHVTVKATAGDYVAFMNGEARGTRAMLERRIQVSGNEALALRMNSIFPPGRPVAPRR